MEILQSRLRRPRFSLAELAGLVAGAALALRWPILLLPMLSIVFFYVADRLGLSVIWFLILMSLVGFVLGLILLPIVPR
jgi:hypothetical protein